MAQTDANASLPRDDDSAPVQVLSPHATGTVHISATEGSSANVALASGGSNVVRVASSGAIWFAFGGASVDAGSAQNDSFLIPAGVDYFFLRDSSFTHAAARSVAGAGNQVVTITNME